MQGLGDVECNRRADQSEQRERPQWQPEGLRKERLRVPSQARKHAEILGAGVDAVPALVDLLDRLGMLP